MKARLAILSVAMALGGLQAPGAALAQRDPTGRWDAREFPREQREQRLRACADYKKEVREKAMTTSPVVPRAAPPERPPCGRLKP